VTFGHAVSWVGARLDPFALLLIEQSPAEDDVLGHAEPTQHR
jgi:hypothetical protein